MHRTRPVLYGQPSIKRSTIRLCRVLWVALFCALAAHAIGRAQAPLPAAPKQCRVITVRPGDTLWTIARRFTEPGGDVREAVYAIAKANNIDPDMIHAGDVLRVPVD